MSQASRSNHMALLKTSLSEATGVASSVLSFTRMR